MNQTYCLSFNCFLISLVIWISFNQITVDTEQNKSIYLIDISFGLCIVIPVD